MPMPQLPRQQRRKLRRDLLERGRRIVTRGLPEPLGNEDAVGIALVFYDLLDDADSAERASKLADAAEALLDRTMTQQLKGLDYACRKGCGWCCWQRVTCTAPEVFRVAQWMRANAGRPGAPSIDTIRAAEAADKSGAPATLPGASGVGAERRPCALLLDNACSIHPGRPLPCRAVLSMSAEACRKAMVDPATAEPVPLVMSGMDSAEAVRTLMLAAVAGKGLSDAGYDLPDALAVVLADPASEARWLAGEDVLAGVRSHPRPSPAKATQSRLVEMVQSLSDP